MGDIRTETSTMGDMRTLAVDPDTCRICRGEGTTEEPLFYPCKCSGSIKFVHQECLMEWLSHSQKKHCELCKTPFRFTKLYHPNMPKALPFHVFAGHMAKYILRNLMAWLRAALVVSVWLGWLPYLMRSVWSFLFWISDEGLAGNSFLFGRHAAANSTEALFPVGSAGVCPSSPLFAATTTVATIGGVLEQLPPESAQLVKRLSGFNLTSSDPLYSTILRLLFSNVGPAERDASLNATHAVIENVALPPPARKSLLSDVSFLRNLTRHATINQTIVQVLEGQIITILVIVCFILIILVRDYVVQQQPEINMRAAFAAAENAAQQPVQEEIRQDEHAPDRTLPAELPGETQWRVPPSSSPQYRSTEGSPSTTPSAAPEGQHQLSVDYSRSDVEESTVQEYLKIYREAGGDPEKILDMVKERHLEDKLDYWIRLTKSMMDRPKSVDHDRRDPSHGGSSIYDRYARATGYIPELNVPASSRESDRSSDWTWPDEQAEDTADAAKGKGKLRDDVPDSPTFRAASSRPRSNTDGPKVAAAINPLANNNWSFSDLPGDPAESGSPPPDASSVEVEVDHGSISSGHADTTASDDLLTDAEEAGTDTRPDITNFDFNTAPAPPEAPPRRRQPVGLMDHVADFMWRDVEAIDPAELAGPNGLDIFDENDDAGFGDGGQEDGMGDEMERDQEVVEAAVAAGLDPEAIEDAEDLEGIMELLGMRGPVAGLFQNAIFCAFLVSVTIFVGIFVPYNIGRISFWTIANPMRPARMLFSVSKFLQDCALVVIGTGSWTFSWLVQAVGSRLGLRALSEYLPRLIVTSKQMSSRAGRRILESFMSELPLISASEMRNFSALSHEALLTVKAHIAFVISTIVQAFNFVFAGDRSVGAADALSLATNATAAAWQELRNVTEVLSNPTSWVVNLTLPDAATPVDPELAFWSGTDRFYAITGGYISLSVAAALYLRRGTPFSSGQTGQEWEASIIDGLNQASGVMKVILIIGIEMLIFPLYCGLLLDIALLPLFESTTIKSRFLFSVNYPLTSIFVHWFVGTGYMFHFALFVSMCRKIMRKGVLYFIRDPDDPEFHPVRDVLERSVTTQLRKILFSAFVYGALVVVCLGGVVWGLACALPNVLPIHYSSNEPVLEFPIDLLFYNFLMPLAVKFFKPADGLHAMYTWWFRKCARGLRITWFLFGERKIDEEGTLAMRPDSPYRDLSWWKTLFLELDSTGEVIPKTWRDTFEGGTAKPTSTTATDEVMDIGARKDDLVSSHQLRPDGRFVRTPASDQVKIPKAGRVFLEVTQVNERLDGKPDRPDTDLYSTNQYQFVYVPPYFRVRIFLFIMFIWLFAAVTGVGITIVPLMFGRRVFQLVIPSHIRTNDIYAFSIGIYVLGSATYAAFHIRSIGAALGRWALTAIRAVSNQDAIRKVGQIVFRAVKLAYAYFFLLVVFPLLVASLLELYALIPLHTYMYNALLTGQADPSTLANQNPRHTVRVIQAWTIGLLYLKLSARVVTTWMEGTRLAAAVRAVLRKGWLEPDVAVLTRAFIVPAVGIWLAAVGLPLLFARLTVANGLAGLVVQAVGGIPPQDPTTQLLPDEYLVLIYRLSFPVMALAVVVVLTIWNMIGIFRGWRVRIRDEAYLIGERLHNFGVANAPLHAKGAWKAQGTRLRE
ncbi:hypothetical protein GQ53DRAFT_711715 [Thozetella sp. PMI_491]|nr:hypothetical protein GQ53DRAFT_711715 [Thozetella sp. PMI_491]